MTKQEAKTALVEKVAFYQGIKAVQLVADLTPDLIDFDIPLLLEELVSENKLIEIEYALPNMNWRLKSFYFPAGTAISIRKP